MSWRGNKPTILTILCCCYDGIKKSRIESQSALVFIIRSRNLAESSDREMADEKKGNLGAHLSLSIPRENQSATDKTEGGAGELKK